MIHAPSESFEARDNVASIFAEPDAASITIPDAHLLFTADFQRKGSDLVLTGDDGHKILVADYFRHEKQADLVSPEGALLSASLVELLAGSVAPGQYAQDAQAAAPAAQQPIGRVETVSGSATVTRNGVAVDLNVGDLVFQGDVVQTRSDSTLGIGFADGSAFSLKENARMALNEFVYDPNSTSNSALINLVQGTVSFIASQVAKTGNMRVETPTATLGIRGTFVTLSVSSIDGNTVASLGMETNSATGEQFSGAFTLTNRITGNAVNVSSVNSIFSVSPTGTIGESAKPPAMHAIEGQSFQALSAIAASAAASMGTAPTAPNQFLNDPNSPSGTKAGDPGSSNGPAPGGSSGASPAPANTSPTDNQQTTTTTTTTTSNTPPANTGSTNIPTNTNQTNVLPVLNQTNTLPDIKPTVVATDTQKTDTHVTDTHVTDTPTSQPTTNNPTTITVASATGSFSERANTTNDTTDIDQASGTIAFADPDPTHTHTVTQGAPAFTWSGGSLSSAQKAALAAAGSLQLTTTDSTSSGAGLVAWNYKITDSALDFLAAGQTLTVTHNVTIDDHHGGSVTQPVTVTITGTNDAPVITGGPITASVQEDGGTATRATGQLTATDPDLTDTQTWSIVGASATHTPNYQFKIDEFKIVKNGGTFFDDTFSDNNPPPSAPTGFGTISSYSVTGTISEQDGKAILTGSNSGFGTGSPSGDPFFGEYATLNTNIDPTNTSLGLKDNSSFTVSGVFDLTLPAEDRNEYGIRLTDRTSSQAGDSTVELKVTRDPGGIERVQLREMDFSSHTFTVLQSITLNPGSNSQILLSLTYDIEQPGVVHASFTLKNGELSTVTNFTATGTIFNNENWTRAQFFAEAPAQSDSILQGTYGQLDITQAGAWTYQLANGQANVQALAPGVTVQDIFTAQVADGNGGFDTKTITVNVTGTNDAPVAVADVAAVTEDALPNPVSGNVLANDTDVDNGDTHSVTKVNGSSGNVGYDVAGTYGTLHLNATGGYTYTLANGQANVQALADGQQVTDVFTYTNSDNHGGSNSSTLTVTVTGTNDAPEVTSAAAAVSEEGLSNGVPDALPAGLDTTNFTSASGTITASDVDTGDALTMTLDTPSTSLTSGGVAITWTHQDSDHTLIGKAGETTIITATITDAGAYNVTLSGPIDHPDTTQEDDKTLTIPVNVSDGHTTTSTTLSVSIEDDSPKAQPVEVSVDTTDSMTNVMLIIDVSGSMDSNSGLGSLSRLDAAKQAIDDLLDQYDAHGDVRVQIVKFSTGAEQVGTDWMTVAAAKEAIDGLSAGGSTFYDDALTTAIDIFGDAGKLSGSNTQNVSYFLSDGEPTASHEVQTTQQTTWESFLTTNNIVSFALGISNSPTTTDLDPIAFDPASGTQLADTPIIVTDFAQLSDTLVLTASSASGSVLSGSNSFGADGGHVQSITVDGVTYTFDPTANGGAGGITVSGGDSSGTYNGTSKTLTVETSGGGELAMVMTTGAFTFQPPSDFSSESVGFVLVDGDGDTASSTLELTAATFPAGVAGSPINLGLSAPAGHVGPVTVTIAGVPAGWTVNGGVDNGYGGWTIPTNDVSALSITSPHDYTGAMAFKVTMSWTNPDHSIGFAKLTDNVEAFAPGAPILAWSGDDHLTGSSGPNLFVFAQPIGHDTVYSFDAREDQIDLIGYAGFTSFNDVQRHLADDSAGNAVIALGTGRSIALLGVAAASLTASNFVFDQTPVLNNAATMTIGDGALLPLAGIINNAGSIALDSAGSETHLQLIQYGMTLQGGGQLVLSDSGENFISGAASSVTLTNVDNTISGAGHLGAGQMTLVNDGTIVATGSHALVIDTGANVVTNAGTLEATGSGGLIVNSDVANSGLIWAHGGNVTMNGAVTGSGTAMISGSATLGFGAASSADITFAADAAGTLTLKDAADFTGAISGFSSNDHIDLTNINYSIASVSNASYSSSTNITTLAITDGTSTDAIKFVGNYTINTTWHFSSDGHGGTLLTDSLPVGNGDLAQTVTAALTAQDGTADQFTFQNDSQSGTPASDPTLVASADPSATEPATLDPTSSSSSDHQPTVTATADGSAVTGLASNVATNTQLATADSTSNGTQAGATAQTGSAASAAPAAPAATGPTGSDTFVFAANFGQETIANFHPDTDVIEIDHTVFADFQALLAAAHDDGHGNAVIAANPHDSITIKNVTVAQLAQHQGDFHFT